MSRFFGREDKRSEKLVAAEKALRELIEAEGVGPVHKLYADAVSDSIQETYIKQNHLKESSTSERCLCRLVGKRCPWHYGRSQSCVTFNGPDTGNVMDHPTLFNKSGKPSVFVSQPYSLSLESMRSIVSTCDTYGLTASLDGHSWHYPNWTLFLEVSRRESGK